MRDAFVTASGIPFSNRDLLDSPAYSGSDQLFLSCTASRLSKKLFPAIWNIAITPDAPVIVAGSVMREQMDTERRAKMQIERLKAGLPEEVGDDPAEKAFRITPLMDRDQHRELYMAHRKRTNQSPYGFPFTFGVGGFLYVGRDGEEAGNDPRQFVLQRNGKVNAGVWTQPSGLASSNPFLAMCSEITKESGIVLLDRQKKIATVAVPKFVIDDGGEYAFIEKAIKKFDPVAIKQRQAVHIRSVLETEGLGDYRIDFRTYPTELLVEKLPPRDKVNFVMPLGHSSVDHTFNAFVTKDAFGSANIHLPFRMTVPDDAELLLIDCEGYGRQAALKTQDELLALDRNVGEDGQPKSLVTAVLRDLLERPFKVSYVPAAFSSKLPPRTPTLTVPPAPVPAISVK